MIKFFSFLDIKQTQLFIGRLALALILLFLGTAHASGQGYEITSIEISDFSLTPTTIDTTNSSQAVTITLRAVSPDIPVTNIGFGFRSHTGLQFFSVLMTSEHLISGNSNDGFYRIEAVFPQYSKAGTWSVFRILVFANRNYRFFYHTDLEARGFAIEFQVISDNEDTEPPELVEFNFTPTVIDVADGPKTVTVTFRAKDLKLGVRGFDVSFTRPGEDMVFGVYNLKRVSGDEKDGVYKGEITFSRHRDKGIYNAHVFLSDVLFNNRSWSENELTARGFPSQLLVKDSSQDSASISGRIINAKGQGISKAIVTFTDTEGNMRQAITNPFGYYRFENISSGTAFTLNVSKKGYIFTSQAGLVDSESINLNFTGKAVENEFKDNCAFPFQNRCRFD